MLHWLQQRSIHVEPATAALTVLFFFLATLLPLTDMSTVPRKSFPSTALAPVLLVPRALLLRMLERRIMRPHGQVRYADCKHFRDTTAVVTKHNMGEARSSCTRRSRGLDVPADHISAWRQCVVDPGRISESPRMRPSLQRDTCVTCRRPLSISISQPTAIIPPCAPDWICGLEFGNTSATSMARSGYPAPLHGVDPCPPQGLEVHRVATLPSWASSVPFDGI
ncbi:hypothetical protein KVT40_005230 [Elsinoe batatas]|uniref:Uncharacterized protein n=1 Tax=Elsinoe batatas TaxID=2601811 RepID=A0A8K0KZR6_9PEZI|nr:hypothetical protein KVT40_005230 [Elsinoe batatas]